MRERDDALIELALEYLDSMAERLDELYGEDDGPSLAEALADVDDYPEADTDPDVNYVMGWLQGMADFADVTVLELLGEFDIGEKILHAYPRTKPFRPARGKKGKA